MIKIEKRVTINAPVEQTFAVVHNTHNLVEVWPSLIDVRNLKTMPNGGNEFDWTYRMVGVQVKGTSQDAEFIPNERIVTETKGGISSHFTWTFEADGDRTLIHLTAKYDVPGESLLSRMADGLIQRMNDRELGVMLNNLKMKVEGKRIG